MGRPAAKELTERELEVMHEFWRIGTATVAEVRDAMAQSGRDLAYTTVATLVKILVDKNFLIQLNQQRPFQFQPTRPFEDVSKSLIRDLVDRVFGGSREQLLMRLFDGSKLTRKERQTLENLLREEKP